MHDRLGTGESMSVLNAVWGFSRLVRGRSELARKHADRWSAVQPDLATVPAPYAPFITPSARRVYPMTKETVPELRQTARELRDGRATLQHTIERQEAELAELRRQLDEAKTKGLDIKMTIESLREDYELIRNEVALFATQWKEQSHRLQMACDGFLQSTQPRCA